MSPCSDCAAVADARVPVLALPQAAAAAPREDHLPAVPRRATPHRYLHYADRMFTQ